VTLKFALPTCALLSLLAWTPAIHAQDAAPSADRIRSAAAEYDAGRRAFIERKFEEAAIHFENAYHDAPRAEALRNAIRARREAKQYARAATLAALAQTVYADDQTTMVVVHDALTEASPKLHRLVATCAPACGIVADGRAITLENATKTTLFLDPGSHTLVVSFGEDRSLERKIVAKAGGHEELTFDAPAPAAAPPPPPSVVAPPVTTVPPPAAPEHRKPLGPAVFFVGAGLTAVGIAATTISGIDAINNPGQDKVRSECVGLGERCGAYQDGRDAQARTNVFLGITAGVAVVTAVVGIFFTDWSSSKPSVVGRRFTPSARGLSVAF
jgi:hypothetical protein